MDKPVKIRTNASLSTKSGARIAGSPVRIRGNASISTGLGMTIVLVVVAIVILGGLSLFKSFQVRQPQAPADRDINVLESMMDSNAGNTQFQIRIGYAYYTKAQKSKDKKQQQFYYEKALERYKKALELNPNIAGTRYNIGLTLEALNRADEAIKVYEELYKIEGGQNLASERLGVLYMKKGDVDKAIERFEKAVEVVPTAANFKVELAQAYEKKGRIADAIKLMKIAVRYEPDNKEFKDMLSRLQKSQKK
jgi:tetratricopeptide (TPR) repeat protein